MVDQQLMEGKQTQIPAAACHALEVENKQAEQREFSLGMLNAPLGKKLDLSVMIKEWYLVFPPRRSKPHGPCSLPPSPPHPCSGLERRIRGIKGKDHRLR